MAYFYRCPMQYRTEAHRRSGVSVGQEHTVGHYLSNYTRSHRGAAMLVKRIRHKGSLIVQLHDLDVLIDLLLFSFFLCLTCSALVQLHVLVLGLVSLWIHVPSYLLVLSDTEPVQARWLDRRIQGCCAHSAPPVCFCPILRWAPLKICHHLSMFSCCSGVLVAL